MKLPAIQFYPADWRKDPGIQALDYFDRGVWFEILCLMHESSDRGKLLLNGQPMPDEALARVLGLDNQTLTKVLTTLLRFGVATRDPETGALMNRRMVRDEDLRQKRAECGKRGGNPALLKQSPTNGRKKSTSEVKPDPTPSSSSSSSTSISISSSEGEEGPALQIFEFWKSQMALPDAQFTDDRAQAISERLQDSTVEEIEAAIRGCKVSDFHMGREPGKPQKLNGIEFICQKRSRLESFIAMAPSDNARSKPPPTETAAQRLIRENCPRCFGTTTEVIPGKGGRDCDHKPRTADAGSTGNGSAPQDSEQCVSERSDRHLRAVQ